MILNFRFRLKLCLTLCLKLGLTVFNCVNYDKMDNFTPVLCINIDQR